MNVLLISANREDINMLSLPMGLACVAVAVEKAGHAVRFLDLLSVKDIPLAVEQAIRLSQPEAIGVSVRNIDDQSMDQGRFLLDQAKEVVRLCRESSVGPITAYSRRVHSNTWERIWASRGRARRHFRCCSNGLRQEKTSPESWDCTC